MEVIAHERPYWAWVEALAISGAHKLIPETLVEGFAVKSDAVALSVEPICAGIGCLLVILGHVLHLEPVA